MSSDHHTGSLPVLRCIMAFLSGVVLLGLAEVAPAQPHGSRHREFIDSRYHHNHRYPVRGQYVNTLPGGYRPVMHGGTRYYFHGGIWYRPWGPRFVIVAPPVGLFIPSLPPSYVTIRVGGVPYYYANEVYYMQRPDGYAVVEPPKGEATPVQPQAGQIFVYPRKGQSEKQEATDRYECHSWAANQTGYDPTNPAAGIPEAQAAQKRADYQRAMGACLDGRGYTVK